MKQRHLGTVRYNLDNGWQPSSYSGGNKQLKFDDYRFNDGDKSTTLDDFYTFSGMQNSFNNPMSQGRDQPMSQGSGQPMSQGSGGSMFGPKPEGSGRFSPEDAVETDQYQPTQLEEAQKRFKGIQGWENLMKGGYNFSDSEKKKYNSMKNHNVAYAPLHMDYFSKNMKRLNDPGFERGELKFL
jgi:hypothetical protein